METLVLPTEDQISQHQYWRSRNAHGSPLLSPPKSYLPHSLYRSPSTEFSSRVPVAGSFSGASNPRRKSPETASSRTRGNPKPRNSGFKKGRKDDLSASNIRILQRPVSQEAAMRDLASITGLPLGEVYSKSGLPPPAENLKTKRESTLVKPQNHKQVKKPVHRNEGEFFCGFLAGEEKWAGPAFSNSPPPSSLPIPNFFLRKSEFTEPAQVDIEAATRGLRRILNLDF